MTGKGRGNHDSTSSRGREKARKANRRVEDNTASFPPSSEMPMLMPRFIPSNITMRIITKATRKLYDDPYATWSEFSFSLKEQIFNQFKSKCVWEHRYSAEVAANFHHKARKRLLHSFSKARKLNQKPDWLLQNLWEDLQRQRLTAKFLEKSKKGKKARASEKGRSLHTGGAISLRAIKRILENKLGRPMNQDELFKETHIGRFTADVEEFIRSQPPNKSGELIQPSDEDAERMWMEAVGGPKWGKLTSELEAAKEREELRDAQYIGMQAQYQGMQEQLKSLLASGGFSIPRSRESSPEARLGRERSFRPPHALSSRPPRDRSSRPRQVDPSGYSLGDESSSDDDDNDVVQNTP
ncbi:uncharacterized protein [Nicotiana sylvestris]|uniref:uncharacterized protein n=1 Tax=Nicotiana sylvestris TaxID=4096 RepID=UPI00388CC1BB